MINNTRQFKKSQKTQKMPKICLNIVLDKRMVIFDRKTLSYRYENDKFVISSPDLSKTNIKVKKNYNYGKQHSTTNEIR